ncbi:hypothetical protein I3V78_06410 [Archangium primigenium]|nr:hypothetical protein [Archangium primigenium]
MMRLDEWSQSTHPNIHRIYRFLVGQSATSSRAATPEQVKHAFRRAFETGRLVVLENKIHLPVVAVVGTSVHGVPVGLQGLELRVWLAMTMGHRTRAQALALIQSGRVSELAEAKNPGTGTVDLTLAQETYNHLKGFSGGDSTPGTKSGTSSGTSSAKHGGAPTSSSPWSTLTPVTPEQRKRDAILRERLKTRLYGLEPVYRKYKFYLSLKGSLASIPSRDEFGVRDPNHEFILKRLTAARDELLVLLRRYGFAAIEDFESTIQAYAAAFQEETVAIAMEMMFKYDQLLHLEDQKYQDSAQITQLHRELGATGARKNYEHARENKIVAQSIQTDPELHRYMPGDWERKQEARQKEAEYRALGNSAINQVAKNHPLLAQSDFGREELSASSPGTVRHLMRSYIQSRRSDIRTAWAELLQHPECVFALDKLLQVSRSVQDIPTGSIYDLILLDRTAEISARRLASNLLLAALALVVGLFTFGQGTVAVVAATVSLGLSTYAALEEFRQYEVESAQYGAQLLSDDPSLGWVIAAILGLGLDLAATASAVKGLATAAGKFNRTSNLADFKTSLQTLSRFGDKVRANVLKAAEAELRYRAAVKRLLAPQGQLRISLLGAEQTGGLLVVIYHLARRGVLAFEHFLLELKALNILADLSRLSPEELTRLKSLFEQDQKLLEELVQHGKALGLTDEQVDGFITQLRREERLTLPQLKERIKPRGDDALPPGSPPPRPPRARTKRSRVHASPGGPRSERRRTPSSSRS